MTVFPEKSNASNDSEINTDDILEEEETQKESKSLAEKALTPVGWAIGGALAPVYVGADVAQGTYTWSRDNIVIPLAGGIDTATSYLVDTVGNTTEWSRDNFIFPTAKVVGKGINIAVDNTFVPLMKGIGWSGKCLYTGLEYGAEYTIIPVAKGVGYGLSKTHEYVLVPTATGIGWGIEKTAVEIANSAEAGFDYVLVPLAKGTTKATKAVGRSVSQSVKSTVKSIKSVFKKRNSENL